MRKLIITGVLLILTTMAVYAQTLSESFEGTFPPTGWTNSGATQSSTYAQAGTYSAYFINAADYMITPRLANPGTMTWYGYKGGTGNARTLIETSTDLTNWTERYRGGNIGQGSWLSYSYTFTVTGVYIRFSFVQGGGTALYLDNISVAKAGDVQYRSKQTGNWSSASTWQYSADGTNWYDATTAPSSSDLAITVLNTHTVSVDTNVTADQLVINTGGTLVVNSGVTLTLNNGTGDDLTVNGSLTVTGTISYNASATTACGSGSTIKFNGTSAQTTGAGFPSSVYNLIIDNSSGVTLSKDLTITTKLTMTSGSLSLSTYSFSYASGASLLY